MSIGRGRVVGELGGNNEVYTSQINRADADLEPRMAGGAAGALIDGDGTNHWIAEGKEISKHQQ
jgi:hypothetical protein